MSIRLAGCRCTVAAMLTAIVLSVTASRAQEMRSLPLRFLIIGDMGGLASSDQKSVATAMARESKRGESRFVVTVGDNFHQDGIAAAIDPRWKSEFEEVYADPGLQIPWYPSLGNHDYRGSPEAELGYSQVSTRWKFLSRYYAHRERIDDSTSILIVHLDTSPFLEQYKRLPNMYHMVGQDTKRQLFWLDSVLTFTSARWTIVVGHHPIYASTPKGGNTKELMDELLPILKTHHVPLYVAAHQHLLQHLRNDSMNFVVSGGGSDYSTIARSREDVVFGLSRLGFVSAAVTPQDLRLDFIDTSGAVRHTVDIPWTSSTK
jgi:tartrate-resistant acid phosphatase type 5